MVHNPKHKVHSFRGLLADGGEDEINLERQNLNVAYRIIKFQGASTTPGAVEAANVVKVYRESQSSIDTTIDFTDSDLIAAIDFRQHTNENYGVTANIIIFDNVLFSRNIYVTQKDQDGNGTPLNYYLELEEVPVSASALMQLKLGVARKLNLEQ